uniref:Nucleotide-diphospho-sugar transferase domain-containing protein n=1 Tax=Chrysotila carterae TaxID=13221 RepID=A0A7S4EVS1_CHRCT
MTPILLALYTLHFRLLQLFSENGNWPRSRDVESLAGVVYLDSDASIVDFNVLPEEFFALAPSADLLGSSNWKDPIIMNAGVLLFRNTEWTLRFLANWWSHRAGCNDQISLWQAVFRMWGLSVDEATWSEPTSDSLRYLTAIFTDLQRRDAPLARTDPRAASLGLPARNGSSEWRCDGACGWLFRWSGCLNQPLELPHVLLLPTLPVREQGVDLVALQHYSGLVYRHKTPDQWICHSDNQASRGCAPRKPLKNARNFCKWCKAAAKSARRGCFVKKQKCGMNHKITMCTYEREPKYHCGCEDTLLPQYTLLHGASGDADLAIQAKCGGCPNATYVFNGSDARARMLATAEDGGVTGSLFGAGRAANRELRMGTREGLSGDIGGNLGGHLGGHLGSDLDGEVGGGGSVGHSNESHDWAMRLHSRMVDRERKILLGKEARRTRSSALLSGGRAMMWSLRAANTSGDVRAQRAGTLPFAEQLRQAQQAGTAERDGGNGSATNHWRKKQKLPKALVRAMKKKEKKSRRKAADAED